MAVTPVGTPVMTRATSGSVTGTWGTGQNRTAGNMLYAFVSAGGATASAAAISTPSGWTQVDVIGNTATTANAWVAVYEKVAAGSDAAPAFTATLSGTAAMTVTLLELSGCLNAAPVQASGIYQSGGSSGTLSSMVTTTGLNPTGGAYAVTIYTQEAAAATNTWNVGSGWTNLANDGTTSSVLHTAVDYQVPSTSSAVSETAHWTTDATAFGAAIVVSICPPAGLEVYSANIPSTTVSSGGTTAPAAGTVETWTVASSTGFPAASNAILPPTRYHVSDPVLPSEDIEVIEQISSTSWLVARGADGTTPVAHAGGFTVYQVINAGAAGLAPQWYNVRSRRFGATGNGTTDDSTAIQLAVTECIANGGGFVYFPAGNYKSTVTVTGNVAGAPVYIVGDGRWSTTWSYYGTGDCLRLYDPSNYYSRTKHGAGISGITLDGANATSNAAGFHIGDIFQLRFDVAVQNWTSGTTSKGAWLDNQYWWAEQAEGTIYASNCRSHVVFDNSTGISTGANATGSFDRMNLNVYINGGPFNGDPFGFGSGDGVVFQNGATTADFALLLGGNFYSSTTQYAVLRITGSNGSNSSFIENGVVNFGAELNDVINTAPYTIAFGSSSNTMSGVTGFMDFSGSEPFTVSNKSSSPNNFSMIGVIYGDSVLASSLNYYDGVPNFFPSGIGIGSYAAATSVTANGQSITTTTTPYVPLTCSASFTGLILSAGFWDGQLLALTNQGTGTLTFAASGTSNVADGTADVLPPGVTGFYIYDAEDSLWYRTAQGPYTLPAGTSSNAPLNFTSGTNLTTAAVGAAEFDGTAFYLTAAASSRQVVPAEQFQVLSGSRTFTNNTSAQAIFNASTNGALTVQGSTSYWIEAEFDITGLSSSSHTVSFTLGGTATYTSVKYLADVLSPFTAGTFASWPRAIFTAATVQTFVSAGTNTSVGVRLRGILRINAGGTVIPQITQGTASAAAVVSANSWVRLTAIGSNTVTNVGDWS